MNKPDLLFDILTKTMEYSPRFIHFHEVVNFIISQRLNDYKPSYSIENGVKEIPKKADLKCDILKGYLVSAFDLFYKVNYNRSNETINRKNDKYKTLKSEYLGKNNADAMKLSENGEAMVEIHRPNYMPHINKKKLKIGLANIKVNHDNIIGSYLQKPIVTAERREEINTLLNQVMKESYQGKIDILVFPETCIPFKWMKWLSDYSRLHDIAIVFGMEHLVVNNIAYNFNVTLLPITVNTVESDGFKSKIKAVIPIVRLKNHYSPKEVKVLKGYRYNIPIPTPKRYDLINWKGLRFAVFNCFELTDNVHRSLFRSKVDFLIACEFNRDTNYFSNIVEAVTRDVHCYFIQSNNSEYGDNRVTKPSKTATRDIIKIKGGENSTILVSTIDIGKLREFQKKEHELQMDDNSFKLTPPGFNVYEKRLGLSKNK